MNYNVGNPHLAVYFADYIDGVKRDNSEMNSKPQVTRKKNVLALIARKILSGGKNQIPAKVCTNVNCIDCEV